MAHIVIFPKYVDPNYRPQNTMVLIMGTPHNKDYSILGTYSIMLCPGLHRRVVSRAGEYRADLVKLL